MEKLLADPAPDRFSYGVAKAELAQMRERIAKLEPVYLASQAEGGTLHQAAMYAAPDREVRAYIDKVRSRPRNAKKSYFRMNSESGEIRLASDEVWHIPSRHPDFDGWENIPKVIDAGDKTFVWLARPTGGTEASAYTLPLGHGKTHVVIAAPVVGKKGSYNRVLTSFIDSDNAVRNWLERRGPYPGAGELEKLLFQPGSLPGSGPVRNINNGGNGVNYQSAIPVVDKQGKPFQRSWEELAEIGRKRTSEFEKESKPGPGWEFY